MADKILVLRTCAADLTSHGGFRWPESGPVEAPDWDGKAECGGGLHGLPWGEGDGDLLDWSPEARWLVVEVDLGDGCLAFDGKCKFRRGLVVHCGDRLSAISYLSERAPGRAIVGGTATAGYEGTLSLRWWDGHRYCLATFYAGEDGIEADKPYRVDDKGRPVKVEKRTEG